jgi:hypothetical protein
MRKLLASAALYILLLSLCLSSVSNIITQSSASWWLQVHAVRPAGSKSPFACAYLRLASCAEATRLAYVRIAVLSPAAESSTIEAPTSVRDLNGSPPAREEIFEMLANEQRPVSSLSTQATF